MCDGGLYVRVGGFSFLEGKMVANEQTAYAKANQDRKMNGKHADACSIGLRTEQCTNQDQTAI